MSDQTLSGFPASLQQQRLFELVGLKGNGNHILLRIQGKVNPGLTEGKIPDFLNEEENLRTRFVQHALSKYPLQQVEEAPRVLVHYHFCEDEDYAKKTIEASIQIPFQETVSENLRLEVFDWKGDSHLILGHCSRYFSDFQSLVNFSAQLADYMSSGNLPDERSGDELQYIDFSEWQHELLQDRNHPQAQYWSKLGLNPGHFTAIHKYTDQESGAPAAFFNQPVMPDTECLRALQEIARVKNIPFKQVLMAVWWQLLKTYTSKAFSLAYNHPGRSEDQTEHIFGLFEKNLPLPHELVETDISVWELARKIGNTIKEQNTRHEYFHLGLDQQSGKGILFPYQFAYYEFPVQNENTEAGLKIESFAIYPDAFALRLEVIEQSETGDIKLNITGDANYFPREWPQLLAQQFCWQLELEKTQELEGKESFISLKSRLALAFQQQIECPVHQHSASLTLVDLLEEAQSLHADKPALIYEQLALTYQEVHEISNRLARFIHNKSGGKTGAVIAMQLANPVHMVLCFIAATKSGNAFLPIETGNPPLRVKYLIENSEAILFLGEEKPETPVAHFDWATIESELSNYPHTAPGYPLTPSTPCYVIFTSGTTGNPKGVLITHGNLVNYLTWFNQRFQITEQDNTVLFSSMAFDLGHTIIWSALCSGATLNLTNPSKNLEFLESVNAYFVDKEISYIKCTPSHFKLILGDARFSQSAQQQKLRLVILGGEPIDVDDVARFLGSHPETSIVDEYGPTETTIGVVATEINASNFAHYRRLPVIGQPFGNHRIYILDENQNPVFPGEYGAMYICGPGLSTGYLNLPELTNKSFVWLDFAGKKGYSSGDMGRWLPDGNIQLAGRIDNQVKVRGYRIEPEEISQVIRSMNGVKAAYTMIHGAGREDAGLRSFVVFSNGTDDTNAVKAHLKSHLPGYMIPEQLFVLDTIPLNPNGKVDQDALNKLAQAQLNQETLQLPVEQDELVIAQIWAELFELEQIGMQQNFFQLGGHSLLAMKMLSRLQKQLGVRIPLADFFQSPTVQALVNLVRTAHQQQVAAIQRISQQSDTGLFDLSLAQQRIWMQEQLKDSDGAFNIYFACRIIGGLDTSKLEACLDILVRRHESFRTNFVRFEGNIKQQILAPDKARFSLDQSDERLYRESELETAILEKCRQGFDLEKEALFRCTLLKTIDNNPVLLFNFHHIIMDEWSMDLFIKELTELLTHSEVPESVQFPKLSIQYKDFAAWEQIQFTEDRLRQMQLFFRTQFGGTLPVLNLQTDFKRPEKKSFDGNNLIFECSEVQHKAVLDFCQTHEISLFVFFLTLTKVLLFRLTNQVDLIVGTLEANRNHPDLEHVIGCFFNIIPIRSRFKKDVPFLTFLEQVRQQFNSTLAYALYPFDYLLRDLNIPKTPGRSPVFDVMVTVKTDSGSNATVTENSGIQIEEYPLPALYSKYDLLFDFIQENNSLKLILEYNTNLFLPTTLQEYFQVFQTILGSVLSNPSVRLNEIGSPAEPAEKEEETTETFFNF